MKVSNEALRRADARGMTMNSLDLRSINLGDKNILTFEKKKDAKKHPLPHLCYVTEAANRFWVFYVIVRKRTGGEFEVMCKDGQFLPVEDRRLVGGDKTYIAS